MEGAETQCRACKQPLLDEDTMVADGCPCNSPRGVNHGLVPARVCTCSTCDPAETGSARPRGAQGTAKDPDAPYVCLGCRTHYDTCPDFDAYNCPACGEKVCPVNRPAAKAMLAATQGAAVAGPACVCPFPRTSCPACEVMCDACALAAGHATPLPPASEPPRSYSPTCAGTCWPPCAHHGTEVALFMREDRNRLLVQNADLTAAKAALEVQLRDERAAHARTTELWRRDEEKGTAAERTLRDERDALAAQLEAAREALTNVRTHAHHMPNCRPGRCAGHCPVLIADALAASGPGEGTK